MKPQTSLMILRIAMMLFLCWIGYKVYEEYTMAGAIVPDVVVAGVLFIAVLAVVVFMWWQFFNDKKTYPNSTE